MAPRVSISRTEDATVIKYDHLKVSVQLGPSKPFVVSFRSPSSAVPLTGRLAFQSSAHVPAPSDPGLILTPGPRSGTTSTTSNPGRRKLFSSTDWIFDTGATTHVCANRTLLHHYDTLNPYSNKLHPRAVGYFGTHPIAIVGAGDCTFDLPSTAPALSDSVSGGQSGGYRLVHRITVHNVMHIPEAGVNLISWSQLKRAKGLDLRLVEESDGSLTVRDKGSPLMRFVLRDGLYFLEQLPMAGAELRETERERRGGLGHIVPKGREELGGERGQGGLISWINGGKSRGWNREG